MTNAQIAAQIRADFGLTPKQLSGRMVGDVLAGRLGPFHLHPLHHLGDELRSSVESRILQEGMP